MNEAYSHEVSSCGFWTGAHRRLKAIADALRLAFQVPQRVSENPAPYP
jgi:hypothetical protein